jgi:hypothetical protein
MVEREQRKRAAFICSFVSFHLDQVAYYVVFLLRILLLVLCVVLFNFDSNACINRNSLMRRRYGYLSCHTT